MDSKDASINKSPSSDNFQFNMSGFSPKQKKFNDSVTSVDCQTDSESFSKRKGLDIKDESVHFAYEKEMKEIAEKNKKSKVINNGPIIQINPLNVCPRPHSHINDYELLALQDDPSKYLIYILDMCKDLSDYKLKPKLFKDAVEAGLNVFLEKLGPSVITSSIKSIEELKKKFSSEPRIDFRNKTRSNSSPLTEKFKLNYRLKQDKKLRTPGISENFHKVSLEDLSELDEIGEVGENEVFFDDIESFIDDIDSKNFNEQAAKNLNSTVNEE